MCGEIQKFKDNKKIVILLFVDLCKAFDSVNHNILHQKLINIGIRKDEMQWFKSCLTNRSQLLKINEFRSNPITVTQGVAQGIILGLSLFNIFINADYYLYADDVTIIHNDVDIDTIGFQINADLSCMQKWVEKNHLVINLQKKNSSIIQR